MQHPGLANVAAGRYTMTDRVVGGVDELLGELVGVGFTYREALAIHYGVLTFTTGFVVYETSSPVFAAVASPAGSPERVEGRARLEELADGRHPHFAAAALELLDLTPDELFEQSLTALVEGWAARLRAS